MAAKGVASLIPSGEQNQDQSAQDIYLIAMPLETYKLLSDEATKRNLTFAQAMRHAINDFISKPAGPRLLTEQGKENR